MPWGVTKESALPSLKNKSIESRKLFAEVANASLQEGKDEDSAIFAGLAAVSSLERKKSKELKKSLDEQRIKDSYVPEHVRLLQEAIELKKQQKLQSEIEEENKLKEQVLKFVNSDYKQTTISEMYFDSNGKLVIKYSDGKVVKTKNEVPEEVINKYISVSMQPAQKSLEPMTALNSNGDPEILFYTNGEIVTSIVNMEE